LDVGRNFKIYLPKKVQWKNIFLNCIFVIVWFLPYLYAEISPQFGGACWLHATQFRRL